MGLRLRTEDRGFLAAARRRYRPFEGGGRAALRLELSLVAKRLRGGPDEPRVTAGGRVERRDLDLDLAAGSARMLRSASSLDSLLRIALSFELARRGGFLCHAAAVDGWLFPGRSGSGKSTLGRASPQGRLLADELVGVKDGRLLGTPFWGDFRAGRNNGSRRLRGIFFLDRRSPAGVHPLGRAAALARLLRCVLYFGDDAPAAGALLAAARAAVEAAPAFLLSYDARKTGFGALESIVREALR